MVSQTLTDTSSKEDYRPLRVKGLRVKLYRACMNALTENGVTERMFLREACMEELPVGNPWMTKGVLEYLEKLKVTKETSRGWTFTSSAKRAASSILGNDITNPVPKGDFHKWLVDNNNLLPFELLLATNENSEVNWDIFSADKILRMTEQKLLINRGVLTEAGTALIKSAPNVRTYWCGYKEIFENLSTILREPDSSFTRDFGEDTPGSGAMGAALWFNLLLDLIAPLVANGEITAIADIGCGDSTFAQMAKARWPNIDIINFDFELNKSPELVRFSEEKGFKIFEGSLSDPESIAETLRSENIDPKKTITTSSHIIQEVVRTKGGSLEELVEGYKKHLKGLAAVDMFKFPLDINKKYAEVSIQPEVELANYLTGQFLYTRGALEKIMADLGYDQKNLITTAYFDKKDLSTGRMWAFLFT